MPMRAANFEHLLNIYWSVAGVSWLATSFIRHETNKTKKRIYRGRSHVHVNEYLLSVAHSTFTCGT